MSIESINEYVPPNNAKVKYIKKILDKFTGAFFFIASVVSKAQSFAAPPLMPLFILSSLLCYLAGYSFWLAASFFAPSSTPRFEEWYGFAEFKEQSGAAAFLGIAAALIALAALIFPILTIPAAWAFFTSNTFWVISEYHKLNNPHPDDADAISKQKSYLYYCICMASIGLISAATLTLIAFFPPIVVPLFIFSATLNLGAGITALIFWCDYTFGGTTTRSSSNTKKTSSYQSMYSEFELTSLSSTKKPPNQEEQECSTQYSPLFEPATSQPSNDDDLTFISSTCHSPI